MGDVEVTVMYCLNLPQKDWKVRVVRGSLRLQTRKDRATRSPAFNEVFHLQVVNPAEPLRLEVWECFAFLPDRMFASCTVSLLGLRVGHAVLVRPTFTAGNCLGEVGVQLRAMNGDFGGGDTSWVSRKPLSSVHNGLHNCTLETGETVERRVELLEKQKKLHVAREEYDIAAEIHREIQRLTHSPKRVRTDNEDSSPSRRLRKMETVNSQRHEGLSHMNCLSHAVVPSPVPPVWCHTPPLSPPLQTLPHVATPPLALPPPPTRSSTPPPSLPPPPPLQTSLSPPPALPPPTRSSTPPPPSLPPPLQTSLSPPPALPPPPTRSSTPPPPSLPPPLVAAVSPPLALSGPKPPPPPPPPAVKGTVKRESATKTIFIVKRHSAGPSIWNPLSSPLLQQDIEELSKLFLKKAEKSVVTRTKEKPVSVIDSARERNVGIVLQFLRLTEDALCAAINDMDDDVMSEECIAAILSIFPTADEQKLILSCSPEQRRTVCGKFFFMCAQNRALEQQLRCWLSMCRFESTLSQLRGNIEDLASTCKCILRHGKLTKVLHGVLQCCNELNKDLPSLANATGFSVEDLPKFRSFMFSGFNAASDNPTKMNLLSFCLSKLKFSSRDFEHLQAALHSACKVDIAALRSEVRELEGHVVAVNDFSARAQSQRVSSFVLFSQKALESLRFELQEMERILISLLDYFGYSSSGDPSEVFSALTQFVTEVVKCA